MPITIFARICISSFLFIISFLLSIQTNLLINAFFRSIFVFTASLLVLLGFNWIIKQVKISSTQQSSTFHHSRAKNKSSANDTHNKAEGVHVDLSTPEDDEFLPWNDKQTDNRKQ